MLKKIKTENLKRLIGDRRGAQVELANKMKSLGVDVQKIYAGSDFDNSEGPSTDKYFNAVSPYRDDKKFHCLIFAYQIYKKGNYKMLDARRTAICDALHTIITIAAEIGVENGAGIEIGSGEISKLDSKISNRCKRKEKKRKTS